MNPQSLLYLQIAVMLITGLGCGVLARKVNVPAIAGELIGGVILGPTVLGALAPGCYAWLFPNLPSVTAGRDAVTRLGLLLFMVVAGLEVDLTLLRKWGATIVWTSGAGILIPFLLGYELVLFMPDFWKPYLHIPVSLGAILLGTALSISALPVIARILLELNLFKEKIGVVVMAAATLDDLIGWTLFAILLSHLPGQTSSGRSVWITLVLVIGIFIFALTIGRHLGQALLRRVHRGSSEARATPIAVAVALALLAAAVAEAIGIHAVFGAFLVGIALAKHSGERPASQEVIRHFVLGFFAPIYFVSIGLQANFIAYFNVPLVLLVLLVACVGKIGGAWLGARIGKLASREALAVGFGMNARGAMGMVLASLALEYKLISPSLFVALVMMALVTSVLSGAFMRRCLQQYSA